MCEQALAYKHVYTEQRWVDVVTCEDIGTCAHGASYEDWLTRQLVVNGYEGVMGWEGACAALAVHEQLLHLPVYQVLLYLHTTSWRNK